VTAAQLASARQHGEPLPDGEAELFFWADGDPTPLTND
jgi:hypothetical protein